MCDKEGIGKYDMWYGVVCKFSSNSNFSFSLSFQRDIFFLAVSFFLEKKENIKKGRKRAYQQANQLWDTAGEQAAPLVRRLEEKDCLGFCSVTTLQ